MCCDKNPQLDAPSQVRIAGPRGETVYVLDASFYAVHGKIACGSLADATVVLDDERIAVFHGAARPVDSPTTVGPVYTLQPGGSLAVPTGRVLVRFADGLDVNEQRPMLRSAGFRVDGILPFAPNVAWVRPVRGGICEALRKLDDLESLPGVQHVEPQMLMARAAR